MSPNFVHLIQLFSYMLRRLFAVPVIRFVVNCEKRRKGVVQSEAERIGYKGDRM